MEDSPALPTPCFLLAIATPGTRCAGAEAGDLQLCGPGHYCVANETAFTIEETACTPVDEFCPEGSIAPLGIPSFAEGPYNLTGRIPPVRGAGGGGPYNQMRASPAAHALLIGTPAAVLLVLAVAKALFRCQLRHVYDKAAADQGTQKSRPSADAAPDLGAALQLKSIPVSLELDRVGLRLRSSGATVISDVSARFPAGSCVRRTSPKPPRPTCGP